MRRGPAILTAVRTSRSQKAQPSVAVQVFPAFQKEVSSVWVRKIARQALTAAKADVQGVSVVIADDVTICTLNAQYHGLNEVTDVLSFAWAHEGHWEGEDGKDKALVGNHRFPFVNPKATSIGEIVLSYPQAVRQAPEKQQTAKEEVALLIVHGVLHLLGHDHAEPAEEKRMQSLEKKALTGLTKKSAVRRSASGE